MSNPHVNQPDPVSSSIAHEGVKKPMNNNLGTDGGDAVEEVLEDGVTQGLTPMHRQNIDESRIDEVLVEDNLDDPDYPTIRDIADDDTVEHSFGDDL